MKKTIVLLVGFVLCLMLIACSEEAPEPAVEPETVETEQPTTEDPVVEEDDEEEVVEEEEETVEDPVEEEQEVVYDSVLAEILKLNTSGPQVDENGMNVHFKGNWIITFTEAQIIELGLDGFTGSDKEIADSILQWQLDNMVYADSEAGFNDVSFGMRWNGAFPTIYDTLDIVERQKTPEGKIYGVCHHYANIFAAAADYYGLTVRVGNANESFADLVDNPYSTLTTTGMSGEEYNAFKTYIVEEGYDINDFPYDVVRLMMGAGVGGPSGLHGRAEVYLDGVWVAYDKYVDGETEEGSQLTYSYDTWLAGFNPTRYDELMERYNNGESLLDEGYDNAYQQFLEARIIATSTEGLPGYGGALTYIGVTDDLGQNRAKNVDDIMNGLALAPYYTDEDDILDFFGRPNWLLEEIDDVMFILDEIETITGEPYYVVAEIMTWGEEDITEAEIFVEQYEGFSGVPFNISLWEEYVK